MALNEVLGLLFFSPFYLFMHMMDGIMNQLFTSFFGRQILFNIKISLGFIHIL